jgi:hypothetical protein
MKNSIVFIFLLYSHLLSAQDCESVLVNEKFENNNALWPEVSDSSKTSKVVNGKYIVEGRRKSNYPILRAYDITNPDNLSISVTATLISGTSTLGFGLAFGGRGKNRFVFQVSPVGQFMIYKSENGKIIDLVKWTESSFIKREMLAENTLTLKTEKGTWNFYINDQVVSTIPSQAFMGYNFGFISSDQQTIAFDNFSIVEKPIVKERWSDKLKQDDFNVNKGWREGASEKVVVSVSNGKLNIDLKDASMLYSDAVRTFLDPSDNFSVSFSTKKISVKDGSFGFHFGNKDNYFLFYVMDDGYYSLEKMQAGITTKLIDDSYSPFIKTGIGAENKLFIRRYEGNWRLYVNGNFLDAVPALPLFGDLFGPMVEGVIKMEFDDFEIKLYTEDASPEPEYAKADSGRVKLFETFKCNASGWPVGASELYNFQVADGKYSTDVKSARAYMGYIKVDLSMDPNYSISVSIAQHDGSDKSYCGLLMGYTDVNNYYAFTISKTGSYNFYKITDGVFKDIIKWTPTDAFKKSEINYLTIKKEGTGWKLFINGKLVNTAPCETRFHNTHVGIMVNDKQYTAFDNFVVKGYGSNPRPAAGQRRTRN